MKTDTVANTDPMTELLNATETRFHAVVALLKAYQAAGWTNGEAVSGQQIDDACGREIGVLALAHMRYREAEFALTAATNGQATGA
jgi:hypothetical protein